VVWSKFAVTVEVKVQGDEGGEAEQSGGAGAPGGVLVTPPVVRVYEIVALKLRENPLVVGHGVVVSHRREAGTTKIGSACELTETLLDEIARPLAP